MRGFACPIFGVQTSCCKGQIKEARVISWTVIASTNKICYHAADMDGKTFAMLGSPVQCESIVQQHQQQSSSLTLNRIGIALD
jgi:hypothetical protein